MRILLVLLALLVAVAATVDVVAPLGEDVEAAPLKKRLLGICILGIPWLGDCRRPQPRPTNPPPAPSSGGGGGGRSSSGFSSGNGSPTGGSGGSASGSANPSPSASGDDSGNQQSNSTSGFDSAGTPGPSGTPAPSGTPGPSATPAPGSSLSANGTTTFTSGDYHTFTYDQPAIPWRKVSSPGSQFTVMDGNYISPYPTTRRYTFNLEYTGGAPDGFERRMATINGQFPGPLIEANQGDSIEVTVNNRLDTPQSIHWHGMRHNGTNSEDGVPGISQCPIPVGGTYTYKFKFESEMGTYWYHSHYGNTLADGIVGGIVVHSRNDPLKQGRDYDEDRIIYLNDWQNDQSDVIVHKLHDMEGGGYRGSPIMGPPDSVLINGIGQADCSKSNKNVKCTKPDPFRIKTARGRRVRFRVVHTGAHALLRFSIDKHPLKVIEADDHAVQPFEINEIPVWPGQRYSVVVTLDKGNVGGSFYIRARNAAACIVPVEEVEGLAVLQYTSFFGMTWFGNDKPKHQPWGDLKDAKKEICHDLDHYHPLTPLVNEPPPAQRTGYTIWNSAFGKFKSQTGKPFIGFGLNGTTYTNYINKPLLTQIILGRELDKEHVPSITWDQFGAYDLVLNQHDPSPLAHPFHLHGRPFYIMARGEGFLTSENVTNVQLNTVNPARRDVLSIPGTSWAILRVITDTPGVWPLHCHIGWHLAVGKLGVIVVRPNDMRKQYQSGEWHNLCSGVDPNQLGPGRRSFIEEEEDSSPAVALEADAHGSHLGSNLPSRHRHKRIARRLAAADAEKRTERGTEGELEH